MKQLPFILLIIINLMLMYALFTLDTNTIVHKGLQIAIVIVTFILFRMYASERGFIKKK